MRSLLVGVFAAALAGLGCDRSGPTIDPGKLHPVKGRVLKADGPAVRGVIEFTPVEAEEAHVARGEIRADGSFVLQTDGLPGAVPGRYQVMILPPPGPRDPKDVSNPILQLEELYTISAGDNDLAVRIK